MTKAEILALGVSEGGIRELQTLYNRDLNKAVARAKDSPDPVRAAIAAMVPMLRRPENLRQLLASINFMYWVENQPPKQKETAPGATNTEDGKAEQEVTNSTPIVGAYEGDCQA